jgi:hypothetical protein
MKSVKYLTTVSAVLTLFLAAQVQAVGQAADKEATLETLFGEEVSAEGQQYRIAQSNLLAYGAAAIPFLERKLTNDNLHTRIVARATLSWIRQPETNTYRSLMLSRMLSHARRMHSPMLISVQGACWRFRVTVDGRAARYRVVMSEQDAVPFLLEVALKGSRAALSPEDSIPWDRCVAAGLVGAHQGEDIVPLLAELLKSPEYELRTCAAIGLHRSKTPAAVELLIHALSDKSAEVRRACRHGLLDLTDQDFGENERAYQDWWQRNRGRWPFNDRTPGQKDFFWQLQQSPSASASEGAQVPEARTNRPR